MKLQSEYNDLLECYKKKYTKEQIKAYIEEVKTTNDYKNLDIRISNDMLRAAVGSSTICEWYDKYNCNDTHITTLALKVYKDFMAG